MPDTHIELNESLKRPRDLIEKVVRNGEAVLAEMVRQRATMTTTISGDGTQAAHFAKTAVLWGVEGVDTADQQAKAKLLYEQVVAADNAINNGFKTLLKNLG